jgi:hypothetical protein
MAETVNNSTGMPPRVTVLMPVYNGEKYLREAIESILGQSFQDFEFLIVNDGSTDRSVEIIDSYADKRIRLVHNEVNRGLIHTLNRGLELAQGAYVARMDCDDISLPQRLASQVDFLDRRPEIGICGTWFRKFGTGKGKIVRWQTDPASIRCGLLFDAMVGHPTVMMRSELVRKYGLCYDPAYKNAEDFELWLRFAQHSEIANLCEVLLLYRVHPAQITQTLAAGQREAAGKVRLTQLGGLGISPSPEQFAIHQAVSTCVCTGIDNLFTRAEEWLCLLKDANDRAQVYSEPAFSQVVMERWLTFCKKAFEQGHWSMKVFLFGKLMKKTGLGYGFVAGYLLRQLRNG